MHEQADELRRANSGVMRSRASGPAGQNVNKVATAVELRVDRQASSLPDDVKTRLSELAGNRMTADGVLLTEAVFFSPAAIALVPPLIAMCGAEPSPSRPDRAGSSNQSFAIVRGNPGRVCGHRREASRMPILITASASPTGARLECVASEGRVGRVAQRTGDESRAVWHGLE